MVVDTGWGGHNKRDAERIAAAAKAAGVKKIDYLVITHYHADHVGGVAQLAEKLPDPQLRGSRRQRGKRQGRPRYCSTSMRNSAPRAITSK